MEKKLAVIVDNKGEITTEGMNTKLCSSACNVAMETCSSERHDACGECLSAYEKSSVMPSTSVNQRFLS